MEDSTEHVLPRAITYERSLRVDGFLCRSCNNCTGTEWDAELAAACQPGFWTDPNYPDALRKSGRVRRRAGFLTSDGEVIRGTTDRQGSFREERRKPKLQHLDEDRVVVSLQGSLDDKEFREQIAKVRQGFREIDGESGSVEHIDGTPFYEVEVSNHGIRKALVKSYLALAYYLGIDTNICKVAIPYLRGETPVCILHDPPTFMLRERDVMYRHVVLLYNIGPFLMGGSHISGLHPEMYRRDTEGEPHREGLVPALLSREYDGPSVMSAYVVDVRNQKHEVVDIHRLLRSGVVRFNQREPE